MGINKEVLHKDLIGIFEDEEKLEAKLKNEIGQLLKELKPTIDKIETMMDYYHKDYSVADIVDIIKKYGGNLEAKNALISIIRGSAD